MPSTSGRPACGRAGSLSLCTGTGIPSRGLGPKGAARHVLGCLEGLGFRLVFLFPHVWSLDSRPRLRRVPVEPQLRRRVLRVGGRSGFCATVQLAMVLDGERGALLAKGVGSDRYAKDVVEEAESKNAPGWHVGTRRLQLRGQLTSVSWVGSGFWKLESSG